MRPNYTVEPASGIKTRAWRSKRFATPPRPMMLTARSALLKDAECLCNFGARVLRSSPGWSHCQRRYWMPGPRCGSLMPRRCFSAADILPSKRNSRLLNPRFRGPLEQTIVRGTS
jgi:hypothetical protein